MEQKDNGITSRNLRSSNVYSSVVFINNVSMEKQEQKMSFNGIEDNKLRKYYDIEYTATAYGAGSQRVFLNDIDHDDFSEEALEDAKEEVRMNPECEGDLFGEWEMADDYIQIQEYEEGDNSWECVLCNDTFIGGFGNNPDPVVKEWSARCCDSCNTSIVLPARDKEAIEANK